MEGKTLGHYKIVRRLGAGGMGEVYLAHDPKLSRDVAIKVLPERLAANPEARARFSREASAIAALKHPNIVTIYSVEEDAGTHFLTMELVEGRTLAEAIPQGGLPPERLFDIAIELCDALASAHAKGILHRDIKPANIMLDADGRAKILDFGLAKSVEGGSVDDLTITSDGQTKAGSLVGTAGYMSPEQAEGRPVDPRADIFSMGIVLYEMATGGNPFRRETLISSLSAILKDTPPPLREQNEAMPRGLGQVVERCLQKSPQDRFDSAAELRDRLRALRDERAAVQAGHRPAGLVATLRRPAVALPLVVVLLALVGGAAWMARRASKAAWAREQALPELERLVTEAPALIGGLPAWEAFRLGRQLERLIPEDPALEPLRERYAAPLTIETQPPGATVRARPYGAGDELWDTIGTTPLHAVPYSRGLLELRIEKDGYEPLVDLFINPRYRTEERGYDLREAGGVPAGMVWVPGNAPRLVISGYEGVMMPGLEHLPHQEAGSFVVDRFEVTNEEFRGFVDAGGYDEPGYWKHPFVDNGRKLSWQEAIDRFTDKTDRPGPATWEVGDYPDGKGSHPVTGVSWFEAAAYAEFAGKSLPTIYHWDAVALTWGSPAIVPASNVGGREALAAGEELGMNRFGAFALAGNAREWCFNATDQGRRFILGGGWNDPDWSFNDAYAQSPWDRSVTNGFRCMQYVEGGADRAVLERDVELPFRDILAVPRVSDETFALYLKQFDYDPTPLNAVVQESVEEEDYVRQTVTLDAAYGGERLTVHLFLPRNASPPYQTLVYYPGSGVIHNRSSEDVKLGGRSRFTVKSGRAVAWPVYKGTFERGGGITTSTPDQTNNYKEHVVMWGKDLRRTIDYLEEREDLDSEKLGYLGASWGARVGAIMMAIEPRFKVGVVFVAGLKFQYGQSEVDEVQYLPHIKIPVLMLNGRYDFIFPYETSQVPYHRLLGTPEEHKKLVVYDAGHSVPQTESTRDALAWLERYLGPVD